MKPQADPSNLQGRTPVFKASPAPPQPQRPEAGADQSGHCTQCTVGMEFVSDALFDGRPFRALTVMDHFAHQSLDAGLPVPERDGRYRCDDVAGGKAPQPAAIKVDNGSEFVGGVMDPLSHENSVEFDFCRCGTRADNALVESLEGRPRQECLNEHCFLSLTDARSQDRGLAAVL